MGRPEFITNEDILRWNQQIEKDNIPQAVLDEPVLVEVMYAGLWLVEQLKQLQCPDEHVIRIQYTAGAASFGRDPWEAHLSYLQAYKDNDLEFELDFDNLN